MKAENLRDRVFVQILEKLDKKERDEFKSFIQCQAVNKETALLRTYEQIADKILRSRKNHITTEEFLQGTTIRPSQLNKQFSILFHLLNEYLDFIERRKHPQEHYRYLFDAYERLQVSPAIIQKEHKRAIKLIESPPYHSENLHLRFWVAHTLSTQEVHRPRKGNVDYLAHNEQVLDHYYLITKLKYLCAIYDARQKFNHVNESPDGQSIFARINHEMDRLPALGKAYALTYRIMYNRQMHNEDFATLLNLLENNAHEFPAMDSTDLYGYILNICMPGVSKGDQYYEQLADQIYMQLLGKGLLLDGGKLSPFHFINLVKLRGTLGYLNWVEEFIAIYGSRLAQDFDGITKTFATGLHSYFSGQFGKATTTFRTLIANAPEDIFWALELRSVLWKCLYHKYDHLEPHEFEEMERLYDAFRIYVSRNDKIPTATRLRYQNYIRFCRRLQMYRDNPTYEDQYLMELRNEILMTEELVTPKWLLGEIAKLSQKKP